MSAHHDDAHGSADPHEWLAKHMGGIIDPFGKRFEATAEKTMYMIVNGWYKRIGLIGLVVMTPLIAIEFLLKYAKF